MVTLEQTTNKSPQIIFDDQSPFPEFAPKQLTIAVDYDETISAHSKAWLAVMEVLKGFGMKIYVVTYRYNNVQEELDLEYLKHYDFIDGLIFTGRRGKKKFCQEHGIHVDIWIDDNPITITHTMKGISAGLFYSFVPDDMEVRLISPPKSIEQAEYERTVVKNLD